MLNFKNIHEKIDQELIFKHITPEYIYFYYLHEMPNTLKGFTSPFSKDNNPSFRFRFTNGKLLFKCFSSGYTGDCVELVQLIEQLSYHKALEFIWYTIHLRTKTSKFKKLEIEKVEPQNHLLEVITRDFTDFDYSYWNQFHITPEMLIKYNIKACQEVWANKFLWYSNIPSNPCYRYLFNGKYKIYKPLETNKKLKFNNACDNLKNIQGIENIFDSDTIFITKSYKDVIVLNEYINIPSISFHGEGHFPPEIVMKWLNSKFKRIILFYDNDEPGIKASNKLKEFLETKYNILVEEIFIPEMFKKRAKDPSDFIKEYGIENLKSTIKYLLNGTNRN
jgi:5S rRNA maturation endonuclease (ribonuclease M5)